MPWAVVHGPPRYAGLNVPNLYTEQFLLQLVMLLQYGRQLDDMTGILVWATMESMKIEMGLLAGGNVPNPTHLRDLMTNTWIKWLWVDCIHYDIEIYTDITDFPVPCSRDIELMQLFVQNGCHGQELSILN